MNGQMESIHAGSPRAASHISTLRFKQPHPRKPRPRDLAARCVRVVHEAFALRTEGRRRECRVPNAPAASCVIKNTRVSHHRYTGNHPAFPAQWFYGLLRALLGDQACLTPSSALLLADLTPASGRQNHTTSPYAAAPFVWLAIRAPDAAASTASRSAFVTCARPSVGQDGANQWSDLGPLASENF